MDHQLIELELFMFVSTVHGEKCVEVNIAQSLLLLSVHNLATHLMVCNMLYQDLAIHRVPWNCGNKKTDPCSPKMKYVIIIIISLAP